MGDSDYSIRSNLRFETPSKDRSRRSKTSTPYRLKSAEKYLNNVSNRSMGAETDKSDYEARYSRSSSPLFLREQMKAEAQIRAERDADLKTLRRSVSPKRPKSPGSKSSPRSRSTSPIPLRYSLYTPATPYEEYKSAITSLRNLRDNPSYRRSPPGKERVEDSNPSSERIVSGATLDSGIGVARYADVETTMNYSNKSPLGTLKSPTWHKMDRESLQDAVEESEQRRMLLVNRLKDAQDTLKLQASTIATIKSEKERYKAELESLNFSKEESYNEKRNLNTRIKLLKSKCDELDEEVKELTRSSSGLKQKMEEKGRQCTEKNDRINELENELAAIRLSSADNGDQLARLQDNYNRCRGQASLLEQQNAGLTDQVSELTQERDMLSSKSRDIKSALEEAECAITQLKSDLAISERERRELEEERRSVISHKLDAQEALTKSNEVNMDLQAQTDVIIEARDRAEKECVQLRDRINAIQDTISSKDMETSSRLAEIQALQRENRTLREINDNLKDRVDDSERAKLDAEQLIELLRTEKEELFEQKTDLFNMNESLNDEVKVVKIELNDRKQENEMLSVEKEDERKEKLQLQQLLDTLSHDSETQKAYLETQCEDLEKDIQRLQKELEIVTDENATFSKELSTTREEVTYYKEKTEEWKNTAQSLEDSLNLSEQERQGVVEDLLRIQNELTDLKDEYSVIADERNRFLEKYNELRSECEALQEEVRELLLEKDENQHVTRLLETQKAILEEKWNGGRDLEAAQEECIELREDVKVCRERVKEFEEASDELRNELSIAQEKISTLLLDKKKNQENLGRADKTIDLLNGDKERLTNQVATVTREYEKRMAVLDEELDGEQIKVLRRTEENASLKKRLDEALNIHGTEKADLIRERNSLQDRITALERVREDQEKELGKRSGKIGDLEEHKKTKEGKEGKLADALKAITGNPDVEDPYVEAARFMREVKTEKETFEKEANKIPGLESRIKNLEGELSRAENSSSERGAELELKSASIEQLEESKSGLEETVTELESKKQEMEKHIEMLEKEKEKLEKLEVEHADLSTAHTTTVEDLSTSRREMEKLSNQKDAVDVENKRVKAENTKLSIELTDLKKALAGKGDGEKAMLEASNELRVVRDELEHLMEIISTKDAKIEDLNFELEEVQNKLDQAGQESDAKNEEIKTLRSQVREVDRQKERTGELDLDTTSILREKEEQLQRKEEWIESYKSKIEALEKARLTTEEEKGRVKEEKKGLEKQIRDLLETVEGKDRDAEVMNEVLVEIEAEKETLEARNSELQEQLEALTIEHDELEMSVSDEPKGDLVRKLHMVEEELKQTKARLQSAEDDSKQELDIKDMKTPEEVAKIIEDIKEAFEDEIADLLMQEREQFEKDRTEFQREREEFKIEQEEFLKQAEEIAAEQMEGAQQKRSGS